MLRKQLLWLSSAFTIVALAGCDSENSSDGIDPMANIGQNTGALVFSIDSVRDHVVGFKFNIYEATAASTPNQDNSRGTSPLMTQTKLLEPKALPSGLRDTSGEGIRFSDAYFVLPAGIYNAEAVPLERVRADSEELVPSSICSTGVSNLIEVKEGVSTEIYLESNCRVPTNGGVDVAVAINENPVITNLIYNPSKFIGTNEKLILTVKAVDAEQNNLSYYWEILNSAEQSSRSAFTPNNKSGDETIFSASIDGKYEARVTVCDDRQQCSSLDFPIYVGSSIGGSSAKSL